MISNEFCDTLYLSYYSMIKFFLLAILASLIFKALHISKVPLQSRSVYCPLKGVH